MKNMLLRDRNHPSIVLWSIGNEGEEGNISSYTTINQWNTVIENDFIAGGFIWSGADREELKADGQDVSFITVHLEDADGNFVQTDDKLITASVEGEGIFLGIDNGDLRREKSFAGNALKTYFGQALVMVQSTRRAGSMKVKIQMEGAAEPCIVDVVTK